MKFIENEKDVTSIRESTFSADQSHERRQVNGRLTVPVEFGNDEEELIVGQDDVMLLENFAQDSNGDRRRIVRFVLLERSFDRSLFAFHLTRTRSEQTTIELNDQISIERRTLLRIRSMIESNIRSFFTLDDGFLSFDELSTTIGE